MIFSIVKCGDCNYVFAVERNEMNFYKSLDSAISEFHCPSCTNQLWEHDTSFLGEMEFNSQTEDTVR